MKQIKAFWNELGTGQRILLAFLISFFVVVILSLAARAQQVEDYDTANLFARTAYEDSVSTATDTTYSFNGGADQITLRYPVLTIANASADTVTTREIALQNGGNDVSIYVNFNTTGGTALTVPRLGIIKGREQGIVWYAMADTLRQDTTFVYSLGAQTWGPQDVLSSLLIQFQEIGSQATIYAARVRHFRWK